MCIGTNDVVYLERDVYGADYCLDLARDAPDLAITNADNWCYYFTSYQHWIIQSGFNWSGLPEKKSPLVGEVGEASKCWGSAPDPARG